jgi:hypothetical protein
MWALTDLGWFTDIDPTSYNACYVKLAIAGVGRRFGLRSTNLPVNLATYSVLGFRLLTLGSRHGRQPAANSQ